MATDVEKLKAKGWIEKYGLMWPPSKQNPAAIEQFMFLGKNGEHKGSGFGGPEREGIKYHFKNFITLLFAHSDAIEPWEWNPNTIAIIDAYFEEGNQWVCIVGHGSSAKSRTVAGIAVADYLMDPERTSCLLTSTTLPDGKKRVWADVARFWYNAGLYYGGEDKLPGILTGSTATIRYCGPMLGREDEARGIALIPSGQDADMDQGISKMIGFKAPRLRLFIDEASHISWRVVEAAESNLQTGGQVDENTGVINFRVMATLNPNVKTDTGGKLCCPVRDDGELDWKSVDTHNLSTWRNKRGITIRFNGYESPNVKMALEGKCEPWEQRWTGLLNLKTLEEQKQILSWDNFQRQYMGIWPESEAIETIFTDAEIRHHGGHHKVLRRRRLIAEIKGFDPSFKHDGDGAPMCHCDLVEDDTGLMVLEYQSTEMMDDDLDPTRDKTIQLENKVAQRLTELGVKGRDFGMDTTGAGSGVDEHIREKWPGEGRLGVIFNAEASEHPISALDPTPAKEKYENLGTELWMVAKLLLASGQLKNLPEDIIKELTSRRYGENGGHDKKGRTTMEPTKKMKKRLGRSPDRATALLICAQVARMHYGLRAAAKAAIKPKEEKVSNGGFDFSRLEVKPKTGWANRVSKYSNLTHSPPSVD
jgi:hypothetical protein